MLLAPEIYERPGRIRYVSAPVFFILSVALFPDSRLAHVLILAHARTEASTTTKESPLRAEWLLAGFLQRGLLQRFYGISTVLLERVVLAVVFQAVF